MTTGIVAAKAKAIGREKVHAQTSACAQLFQQQIFERRVRTHAEEVDPARLAELAQALDEILHGLLIRLQPIAAEGHFLHRAGLGIDQSQIAESGGRKFFGREDLNGVHLKSAADQRGQARFITGGIEKIAEHDGDAGLPRFQRAAPQRLVEVRRRRQRSAR